MKDGKLKAGGMGRGYSQWNMTNVRGDVMVWLRPKDEEEEPKKGTESEGKEEGLKTLGKESLDNTTIASLLLKTEELKEELNRACNFKSSRVSVQLACYPKTKEGRRYARHLDSFEGGPDRRLTCIYYANPDWKEEDGGKLRMYLDKPLEVEPKGDRLLIFLSGRVEHEVLQAFQDRFAITTWMY